MPLQEPEWYPLKEPTSRSHVAKRLPSLVAIETTLRARQRTAWLGALFAVVGLQTMVGLMVGKALWSTREYSIAVIV